MTVGFSKTNQELAHWDLRNITEPIATEQFELPMGATLALWDEDSSLLFLGTRVHKLWRS